MTTFINYYFVFRYIILYFFILDSSVTSVTVLLLEPVSTVMSARTLICVLDVIHSANVREGESFFIAYYFYQRPF